ncbi:MAG: hypothetical protein GF344_05465 [Chitinivibrionales bacterium]|nr:hypothetical protein [Chitinivibrionales bacterium]
MNVTFKQSLRRIPTWAKGRAYPAWALIAVPFIALTVLLFKRAKEVNPKCLIALILIFEFTVLVVEHNSVTIGHWVYNENRIFGVTVWGVPIEEPLIYYLFPPIMVVCILHLCASLLKRKQA